MGFSLVQQDSNTGQDSIALNGVAAGNLIVIGLSCDNVVGGHTVSDGISSLTMDTVNVCGAFEGAIQFGYLLSANGGDKTYTVTWNGSAANKIIYIMEFSFTGASAYADPSNRASGTGSSASSGNITTTGTNELVLGLYAVYGGGSLASHQVNGLSYDGSELSAMYYRQFGAAFTGAATATFTPGYKWLANVISFKTGPEVIHYVDPDAAAAGDGTMQTKTGVHCAFQSINAMDAALGRNLTTYAEVGRVICSSNLDAGSGTADSTVAYFSATWTTSATYYLQIEANTAHSGGWNNDIYRLVAGGGSDWAAFETYNATGLCHLRLIGLQIQTTGGVTNQNCLYFGNQSDLSSDFRVIKCILDANTTSTLSGLIETDKANSLVYVINTVMRVTACSATGYRMVRQYAGTHYYYSCVFDGNGQNVNGIYYRGALYMKNCAVFNTTDDFVDGGYTGRLASHIALDDYSTDTWITNRVDISPGGTESTDWAAAFTDYANGNYHVKDTNSVLYRAGVNTSGGSAPLNFTDDFEGNERTDNFDPGSITFKEEFESTGYDETGWTEDLKSTGIVDEDYATSPAPLRGTKSLYIRQPNDNGSPETCTRTGLALSTCYGFVRIRKCSADGTTYPLVFRNSSGGTMGFISMGGGSWMIKHGTAEAYPGSYSIDTTYFIWWKWVKGTGSNGIFDIYISTNEVKPASPTASISAGTNTDDVDRVALVGWYQASTEFILFDQFYLDTSAIPTVQWWDIGADQYVAAAGYILDQEGFRFRNDDNNEANATWKAVQDTNITFDINNNVRVRILTDVTGDMGSASAKIQWRKVGDPDSEWRDI